MRSCPSFQQKRFPNNSSQSACCNPLISWLNKNDNICPAVTENNQGGTGQSDALLPWNPFVKLGTVQIFSKEISEILGPRDIFKGSGLAKEIERIFLSRTDFLLPWFKKSFWS